MPDAEELIRSRIRVVDDWPKPGVSFKDLSGVMADAQAFSACIDGLANLVAGEIGRAHV